MLSQKEKKLFFGVCAFLIICTISLIIWGNHAKVEQAKLIRPNDRYVEKLDSNLSIEGDIAYVDLWGRKTYEAIVYANFKGEKIKLYRVSNTVNDNNSYDKAEVSGSTEIDGIKVYFIEQKFRYNLLHLSNEITLEVPLMVLDDGTILGGDNFYNLYGEDKYKEIKLKVAKYCVNNIDNKILVDNSNEYLKSMNQEV
ncbi:hypothetical protein [Clostridium massiliamazoniense]|uniref:hypothetical protein n=1 Tax=Clostridium massiliamazoniense TaxID=1347366 RepID=UPI0006D8135C|nr:hypothetical protein [Clostridium massiliamazoniense]